MAQLTDRISLSINDLENMMGAQKLPLAAAQSEAAFFSKADEITDSILSNKNVRVIFVSGPTASGKTTFSNRLVSRLLGKGKKAFCLSLDNYYQISIPDFDEDGRPDYESIHTLNISGIVQDMKGLLDGKSMHLCEFSFLEGGSSTMQKEPVCLSKDTILVVEGLHGLAPEISDSLPREIWAGIFVMPWGAVVSDRRLLESRDIRLLRRLLRDARHRGAGALSTLDYWPMITMSEQQCFGIYLKRADYYMNTMLSYEALVTAPIALSDIKKDVASYRAGTLPASSFIAPYRSDKSFADIKRAITRAEQLLLDLPLIPGCDSRIIAPDSILNEFL